MTGTGHYQEAQRLLKAAAKAEMGGDSERYNLAAAQVYATLTAAPPPWLRCVDHISNTGTYPLNPAHVIYFRRDKDGQWWEAIDIHRGYHVIASDDDHRVEELLKDGGQP